MIMLAVAAAFWCFVEAEVEPHHLFKNGGSTDPKLQQNLDRIVNPLEGGALLSTKKKKKRNKQLFLAY